MLSLMGRCLAIAAGLSSIMEWAWRLWQLLTKVGSRQAGIGRPSPGVRLRWWGSGRSGMMWSGSQLVGSYREVSLLLAC